MRRLFISIGILLALTTVTFYNSWQLQKVCGDTAEMLGEKDAPFSLQQVEAAQRHWEEHMHWFDIVLNNAEIDHVDEEFQMLKDVLASDEEDTAFSQRNKLVHLIEEIWRGEQITPGNVL